MHVGISIAAAFHRAPPGNPQPEVKQGSAAQQGQLAEDLFVMTAAGALMRHRLMLQQSMQQDADSLRYCLP